MLRPLDVAARPRVDSHQAWFRRSVSVPQAPGHREEIYGLDESRAACLGSAYFFDM